MVLEFVLERLEPKSVLPFKSARSVKDSKHVREEVSEDTDYCSSSFSFVTFFTPIQKKKNNNVDVEEEDYIKKANFLV